MHKNDKVFESFGGKRMSADPIEEIDEKIDPAIQLSFDFSNSLYIPFKVEPSDAKVLSFEQAVQTRNKKKRRKIQDQLIDLASEVDW